jgi:hypothetical protein
MDHENERETERSIRKNGMTIVVTIVTRTARLSLMEARNEGQMS